ncbi:MAG TPA: HEPN domain-containing protein, partial [Mycobacterium sp.]|nr:HEPN domain-containing protein [Mycobacterium sp.]
LMLDRVKKALGHVGDKSFLERAEAVVTEVCAAVPEIGESVARLPARLTDPRHSFAHQLPQDDTKEPLADRARRWTVISQVTPWLLRALLLLHVGVEPRVLREKYLENERFAFYRVNVAQRVRELGW